MAWAPDTLAYLVGGFALLMVALSTLPAIFLSGLVMVVLVVGVPIIVGSLVAARGFGVAERTLLQLTGCPRSRSPRGRPRRPEHPR